MTFLPNIDNKRSFTWICTGKVTGLKKYSNFKMLNPLLDYQGEMYSKLLVRPRFMDLMGENSVWSKMILLS
jgi:hypothetical protein